MLNEPIFTEDVSGTWPSKRLNGMYSFADAIGFELAKRRSGQMVWCHDLWSAKDVRQYARQVHTQT